VTRAPLAAHGAQVTRALLAALLALALLAPAAGAAEPRASLPDIEDEVMCLECGTALNVSTSAVADQERAFIRDLIAQGLTKEEVKAALVDEYGPRVLAEPEERGFALAAWAVPVLAALAALALVIGLARRWRRPPAAEPGAAAAAAAPQGGLDPADARRLDSELAAYDR
jgi:cytochrome c-type biogenesis protein CcmH